MALLDTVVDFVVVDILVVDIVVVVNVVVVVAPDPITFCCGQ